MAEFRDEMLGHGFVETDLGTLAIGDIATGVVTLILKVRPTTSDEAESPPSQK